MLAAVIKNLPNEIRLGLMHAYRRWAWVAAEKARHLFVLLQDGVMATKGQNDPAYFDLFAKAATFLVSVKSE